MDGVHDMGGLHGFGPVVTPDGDATHHEAWEVRAQMVGLLGGAVNRPLLEELPPAQYLSSGYYARWLFAAENGAVDRGIVTNDALERWRAVFASDPDADVPRADPADRLALVRRFLGPTQQLAPASSPAFAVGDRVRVRRVRPEAHHRSPRYLRGVTGTVETVAGDDHLPGTPRRGGTSTAVYTVAFQSADIWGPTDEPPFELMIDLWEPYLEEAT